MRSVFAVAFLFVFLFISGQKINAQPTDTVLVNGKVLVGEIGGIEALLTMVGGKVVYAAGPYEKLEK